MSSASYKTITPSGGQALYTDKRSKFYAFVHPVRNEDEALQHIAHYRKEYHDARHVCWAYRVGTHGEVLEKYNDDGEPSSTAGKPILGQLLSRELTQVVAIVVRYFGGVKLGTGGLIVAYRTAISNALDQASIVEIELFRTYLLTFPFTLINPVMMLLKEAEAEIYATDATVKGYHYKIKVPERLTNLFEHRAKKLYQLEIKRTEAH